MACFDIAHVTTYTYRTAVRLGAHRLMLRPRDMPDLRLCAYRLVTTPEARITWAQDVAGNAIATAVFEAHAPQLVIESHARVDQGAPVWPVLAIDPAAVSYPFVYSADEWTDLGALTVPQYPDSGGALARWAEGFVMARPTDTLALLKDLNQGVFARIAYQSREDEGTQSPLCTLRRGWGSCRDLAVLLAETVRHLGFGARIVSGYLNDPDRLMTGSAGPGSTHAWVEVFVPGAGWIALDPTNRSLGARSLIPLAVGRNIAQVMPVAGSYLGTQADLLSMQVSVRLTPAPG